MIWAFIILGILAIGFGRLIWEIVKLIFTAIFSFSFESYKHYKVDVPLAESEFFKKKQMELRLKEADKQNKERQKIIDKENTIISVALSKTREMRIKYPHASEELFETFLAKFNVYSVKEIQQMEEVIRQSHINNELIGKTTIEEEKVYTLNDVNGLTPLEENREDPIIMKVYKIDSDYLLYVQNIDLEDHQLLQSKDYLVVARAMVKIVGAQKELSKMKENIKSKQIDEIFEETRAKIINFRRAKMDYLD